MSRSKTVNEGKRKKKKLKGEPSKMSMQKFGEMQVDSRIQLIMQLIPLGLMLMAEELQKEVAVLCGARYQRKPEGIAAYRHGSNPGTVGIMGQKVPVKIPRVRGEKGEISLKSYEQFHEGLEMNETLFKSVLYGVSCRNYEKAAQQIPGAIGLSKTTVSKRFIKESKHALKEFSERDLSCHDIVAIFIDGKVFGGSTMVIALGITITGEKIILGFVETSTENGPVISSFLRSLIDERGLDISKGVLTVIDGGKGLHSGVQKAFGKLAVIQRCQWHKRENVVSHLSKTDQNWMRKRLQQAYNRPTYKEATSALNKIKNDLSDLNQSAENSLLEGFEETLTLHKLGVFAIIGTSFKTTNCIESINAQAEELCGKIDYWKNSNQRQRWLATALTDIEGRLYRVRGRQHLGKLREALMTQIFGRQKEQKQESKAA